MAFKLCQALCIGLDGIDYQDYTSDLDIVALGTVADIVPLVGENRKIVHLGLRQMERGENVGLRCLLGASEVVGKKLNANDLGYKIAPRLNAAGRLSSAALGVRLLITDDEGQASDIARALNHDNTKRKEMENLIIEEANAKYCELRRRYGGDMSSIVVASEGWHPGVIGLAAARLVERHYLPTIVLAIEGEYARASCRSIEALHMKAALDYFKDYFVIYGGHAAAAGFTIRTKDIEEFATRFDEYVKQRVSDKEFIKAA